jgi:hypothetical protein
MLLRVKRKRMATKKVKAPGGFHWMKSGKSFKLMKDPKTGYKKHPGSSKSANFPVRIPHKKK